MKSDRRWGGDGLTNHGNVGVGRAALYMSEIPVTAIVDLRLGTLDVELKTVLHWSHF